MRILVTGASGFIGQHLCRYLSAQGVEVTGLYSKHPKKLIPLVNVVIHDIAQPFTLTDVFDVAIHLAAYNITHVGDTSSDLYTRINVEGTAHVIRGVKAKRWIFLSTAKVYRDDGSPLNEESLLDPKSSYEKSKLSAEQLFQQLINPQQLIILRSVNVLGLGQPAKAIVPVFFERAYHQQPIEITVSPGIFLQYIAVDDLVNVMSLFINNPQCCGIYNIASQDTITIDDLAQRIKTITRSNSHIIVKQNSQETVKRSIVRTERLQRDLAWKATIGIDDILQKWHRSYQQ